MSDFSTLDIFLHDELIGTLNHLPGDKNHFSFNREYLDKVTLAKTFFERQSSRGLDIANGASIDKYNPICDVQTAGLSRQKKFLANVTLSRYIDNARRNTLSLSFSDSLGGLITDVKMTRTRLPPFFANLLPEGPMREYLAAQANVSAQREFFLLAVLGQDLPGALRIEPGPSDWSELREEELGVLRFSLAGIQLKFSAVWGEKGLTVPVDGVGGSWIVKLPSSVYANVPENEFVMMELARQIGIDVPVTALVPIEGIEGLPQGIGSRAGHAFIVKRFDRTPDGEGIHIEDFAQVFGVYPEKKYKMASYRNIAEVIWSETGEKGIVEFIRRFVFNALIGNGDMHLKNWSLIYPDKKNAALAPAYDFVSTIPYLPEDQLALTFVDSKAFHSLTYEQFKRFAGKARLPEALVLETARQTVAQFKLFWRSIHDFPLDKGIIKAIDRHLETIPLLK